MSNTTNSHKKSRRYSMCGTPTLHMYIKLMVVNPFWKRNCKA